MCLFTHFCPTHLKVSPQLTLARRTADGFDGRTGGAGGVVLIVSFGAVHVPVAKEQLLDAFARVVAPS